MAFRHTAPLGGNAGTDGLPILSDGYRLIELVEKYWRVKGKALRLDEWQKHLLIRVLERCPEGHPRAGQLRHRQCVISIPRQNGKSLLAAILSLYGLLQHSHSPKVLGVARGTEQAKIVYNYTYSAIASSKTLRALFRQTETRGISKVKGQGSYKVLPAKPESIQGYESTLSICDELHVMKPELWNAIVESQTAQDQPLLIGITTAGDASSTLLKTLYERGDQAIAGGDETFGFFCYESTSQELTLEALAEASPAIASGRIDAATILADCKGQPRAQWMRFRLNRFVDGLAEPWVPVEAWAHCAGRGLETFDDVFYSIEVAEAMTYASIHATRIDGGILKQTLVARLVKPTPDVLKAWVMRLRGLGRCTFVMDGWKRTRFLAEFCDEKGYDVIRGGSRRSEVTNVAYATIVREEMEHDNNPLTNTAHALARTKVTGDNSVIVGNGKDIDAAYSSAFGIYAAQTHERKVLSIA